MNIDEFINQVREVAEEEIDRYGLPTKFHLDLSIRKGIEISEKLGADAKLVELGCLLMDVKLGEAFKTGQLSEHVAMGVAFSKELLKSATIPEEEKEILINSVEAHHGKVPYGSLEAEVVANADCYRFIEKGGVIHYLGNLAKRNLPPSEIRSGALAKFSEKKDILSLPYCFDDLKFELEFIPEFLG